MLSKYKSLPILSKIFTWLTIAILLAVLVLYSFNVHAALSMDPNSFECTKDSLMMDICHNPFGSSISWTLIGAIAYVMIYPLLLWPIVVLWIGIGITVFVRSRKKSLI